VINVLPDEKMPLSADGLTRADIIMDPTSTPSRMNVGRLYEQYFNGMSRHTKQLMINNLTKEVSNHTQYDSYTLVNSVDESTLRSTYDIMLGLLKIIGTEQYEAYAMITDIDTIRMLIQEVVDKELYILYRVSSTKKPYIIIDEVANTMYAPKIDRITFFHTGEITVSDGPIMIAPMYMILLAKTADNFLAVSSAKTNHYSLPIGVGNASRYNLPYRNSPTKILSETETRLYTAHVSQLAIAELKDRANSPVTHEHLYRNILDAHTPGHIKRLVDRSVVPYGTDASLELVNDIFNAGGIGIQYMAKTTTSHK
jgi:hypothetical protein